MLATQKAEIRRIEVQSQHRQIVLEIPSQKKKKKKKSHTHKKRLVEWLKAWALSSNPSTATNKQTKEPPH
jgi:hypothetical protein